MLGQYLVSCVGQDERRRMVDWETEEIQCVKITSRTLWSRDFNTGRTALSKMYRWEEK